MKKAVLISLAGHALALASFAVGFGRPGPPPPLPSKIHNVDLVNAPGEQQRNRKTRGETKPSQAVPKTETVKAKQRSGQKVETAPSTEAMSPKGTKKPAKTAKQQPKPAVQKGDKGQNKVAEGLVLDAVFEYNDYLNDMVVRIKEEWYQPVVAPHSGVLKTTIFFTILRDGSVIDAQVWASSGDNTFDRSARDAVVAVDPLPALPEGFKGDQLGVYLDFAEN
jgi:colicin import membrane protein